MELTSAFDQEILALPFYDDGHRLLANAIGTWCDGRAPLWKEVRREDPEKAGQRLVRMLGDDGWLAFLDPRSAPDGPAGGPPGDFRSIGLMREALAYAEDLADFAFSIQALAATPIIRYGSEEQKERYLPRMAEGSLIGAFAVSEPEAGSDIASVGLRAERDEDGGYVLNGQKAWIANAGIADVYVVIARTGEGPGPLGLTAFLVPAGTPGLRVHERLDAVAPRAFAHLSFENCRVPREAVLGRPGKGFVIAMDLLERFRMTVGAAALGFARRAADTALAHARTRRIGNEKLVDLQLTKASLADMDVRLNAAALLVARAGWEADHGSRRFARHSSIAKLYATEEAQHVIDSAVQLLGAAGVIGDSVTERLYRQIRSLRIYEGTSEVMRLTIAGTLDARRAALPSRYL
ncbi:acyl-CoA dehydrogenase family protein [Streptomyces sp. NBC_01264]|uniref:acyl-CoA dehydrogenase family protein n=1 Tax=Streptomyces sp. NBC_01264 TaxID=2903804 RepID=UPI00224ED3BA|nr:acyl-CoA dehydrogenase [Streptomyces sp. NBC_01264]MCX4783102.1 acyl-CoA dehydrogenase family protein [Streptomyces sp. NBC_01264]